MRKIMTVETTISIILLLAAIFFLQMPTRAQMAIYPLLRQATKWKLEFDTRDMAVYETPHFIIKYEPQDADVVAMVAQAAENAYKPVTGILGYSPQDKTLVLIYADKKELNQVFGWSGDQSAMGVYWGGVIQILSPHAWLKDMTAEEFIRSGPMVHEYTHLVFDRMTNGNYPRWFTEGLAQYVEYKVNNYEWRTVSNSLTGPKYSMAEMDKEFDNLPDTSLAYRESFAAVRYIAEEHGEGKLDQVVTALEKGKTLKKAIADSTGLDYESFAREWSEWAAANMR